MLKGEEEGWYLAPAGALAKGPPDLVGGGPPDQLILHIHLPPPGAPHLHAQSIVLCQSMVREVACNTCNMFFSV